jgi:hypothetical protein
MALLDRQRESKSDERLSMTPVLMRRDDDCIHAAMCNLAGVGYDDAPPFDPEGSMFEAWNAWAREHGLELRSHPPSELPLTGHWVLGVAVPVPPGGALQPTSRDGLNRHAVTMLDAKVEHDPLPYRDAEHERLLAGAAWRFGFTLEPLADFEFDAARGALTGKTAPLGGNWATSGDATDLTVTGSGAVTRASTSDATWGRNAIVGTTTYTVCAVQIDCKRSGGNPEHGLLARYVDASNYVHIRASITSPTVTIEADRVIAGSHFNMGFVTLPAPSADSFYTLRAVITASGCFYVWWAPAGPLNGAPVLRGQNANLATGGALASGKVGFMDLNPVATASTRTFDNFVAWVPVIPTVVYSGRVGEVRSDGTKRQDATGVYYGDMPSYRGSPFRVPPAGDKNRISRVFGKLHRNDIEVEPSDVVTDNLTLQAIVTPRYLAPPN